MALSGYFSTNKYNGVIGLYFSWTATQDIPTNSTTIRWNLYSVGGSSGQWWYAGPITVTIGGKSVYSQTSRFKLYGDTAYHKSGTTVITHSEDGTKSVAMSVKAAIYSTSVNCTGSKSYTLDTINRYALVSAGVDFTDEGAPSMDYINPAGVDLVTNLRGRLSWDGGATPWVALNDDGGTYTWTLTSAQRESMRNACPTSNTLAVSYEITSELDGVTYSHSKAAIMTVINAAPTPAAVTFRDADASIAAITGGEIVQKQSTLEISTGASTGNKGASISKYTLTFNGETYESASAGVLLTLIKPDISGTLAAVVVTTDSRGNTASASVDIPITAWQPPSAETSLARINGFETNTILHVDANISTVTGSTLAITERHKEAPSGAWSTPASVPDATDVTLALNNQKEWIVEVTVSDAFDSAIYTLSVGKGIPIIFIDKDMNSVGFNGFPTEDDGVYFGGRVSALIEKNTTIADCLVRTSGNSNVTSVEFSRACMTNQLCIRLQTTGAVSSGSNIWNGYLGNEIVGHKPSAIVTGGGFYNGMYIGISVNDNTLTVRNASGSSIASGANMAVSVSWISN